MQSGGTLGGNASTVSGIVNLSGGHVARHAFLRRDLYARQPDHRYRQPPGRQPPGHQGPQRRDEQRQVAGHRQQRPEPRQRGQGGPLCQNGASTFSPNGGLYTFDIISYSGAIQGYGVYGLSVANPNPGTRYLFGTTGSYVTLKAGAFPQWSGTGSTANWSDSANWSGIGINTGDQLVFDGNTRLNANNDQANTTYNGMIFNPTASSFTLSGSGITNTGDILNSSPNPQTINLPMVMNKPGGVTFIAPIGPIATGPAGTIDNGGQPLNVIGTANVTFGGSISGAGALAMNGSGTLALNAANSFSGNTRVTSGILSVGHAQALQGSTLDMNAADSGAVTFNSLSTATLGGLQGTRNLGLGVAAATVGSNNASTTYAGVLSGGSGLTKTGNGMLTLSAASTYGGSTLVSGGTLQLAGATSPASRSSMRTGGAAAVYSFTNVSGSTVVNTGTLGSAKNATLTSGATVVADPTSPNGVAMKLTGGANNTGYLAVNKTGNAGLDLSGGLWTASIWYRDIFPTGDMGGANSEWRTLYHEGGSADNNANNNDTYQTIVHLLTTISELVGRQPEQRRHDPRRRQRLAHADHGRQRQAGWTKFYIDGTYVSQTTWASSSDIWSIGARGADNAQQFANYLDDFTFYQRVLSPTDITTLFQSAASVATTLPSTSPVNVANGVLDIEGGQIVGPLSGSTSASVQLNGNLVVNGVGNNTTFAGVISGGNGLTKAGPKHPDPYRQQHLWRHHYGLRRRADARQPQPAYDCGGPHRPAGHRQWRGRRRQRRVQRRHHRQRRRPAQRGRAGHAQLHPPARRSTSRPEARELQDRYQSEQRQRRDHGHRAPTG